MILILLIFENYLKKIFPAEKGYFTQQDQRAINGNKPDFIILKNNYLLCFDQHFYYFKLIDMS